MPPVLAKKAVVKELDSLLKERQARRVLARYGTSAPELLMLVVSCLSMTTEEVPEPLQALAAKVLRQSLSSYKDLFFLCAEWCAQMERAENECTIAMRRQLLIKLQAAGKRARRSPAGCRVYPAQSPGLDEQHRL